MAPATRSLPGRFVLRFTTTMSALAIAPPEESRMVSGVLPLSMVGIAGGGKGNVGAAQATSTENAATPRALRSQARRERITNPVLAEDVPTFRCTNTA